MEIPRSRLAISSIPISAHVVEHPQDDPIVAVIGELRSIVPCLRGRDCLLPDKPHYAAEGCFRKVVCRERRRHIGIGWFEHVSPILQVVFKGTNRFLLIVVSIIFNPRLKPSLYLHRQEQLPMNRVVSFEL